MTLIPVYCCLNCGESDDITLPSVCMFTTGSKYIPPTGLHSQPSIHFLRDPENDGRMSQFPNLDELCPAPQPASTAVDKDKYIFCKNSDTLIHRCQSAVLDDFKPVQ